MRSKSLARQLPGFAPSLVLAQNRDDLFCQQTNHASPYARDVLLFLSHPLSCSLVVPRYCSVYRWVAVVASTSTVVDIDQIVGRIGEEGLPAMRASPARGRSAGDPVLLKVITPNPTTIFALVLPLRLRSASVQTIGRVRSVVPNHVGDL